MKKWMIAACVMAVLLLPGCGKKQINLMDYVSVEFSGMDTMGEARCIVDEEKLLVGVLGEEPESESAAFKYYQEAMVLLTAYGADVEPEEDLSNGNKVTATVTVDNTALKDMKVELIGGSKSFTVQGLTEVKEIDLFADLELSYSRYAPFGRLEEIVKTSTDPFLQTVRYSCYDGNNLNNGDTVTIKAKYNPQKALDAGYVVNETEKDLIVEGLTSYAWETDDFSDEELDQLKEKADATVQKWVVDGYRDFLDATCFYGGRGYPLAADLSPITDVELYSCELLTISNLNDSFRAPNRVRFVYTCNGMSGDQPIEGMYVLVDCNYVLETGEIIDNNGEPGIPTGYITNEAFEDAVSVTPAYYDVTRITKKEAR